MADIELVINIPDDVYEIIKNGTDIEIHFGEHIVVKDEWSSEIIRNGTPLPKGHGRLIDADVLADGFEDNYEFCEVVNATPTIIEADKESEE